MSKLRTLLRRKLFYANLVHCVKLVKVNEFLYKTTTLWSDVRSYKSVCALFDGHVVVLSKEQWERLGRRFPNTTHIVLSNDATERCTHPKGMRPDAVFTESSLENLYSTFPEWNDKYVFVLGPDSYLQKTVFLTHYFVKITTDDVNEKQTLFDPYPISIIEQYATKMHTHQDAHINGKLFYFTWFKRPILFSKTKYSYLRKKYTRFHKLSILCSALVD